MSIEALGANEPDEVLLARHGRSQNGPVRMLCGSGADGRGCRVPALAYKVESVHEPATNGGGPPQAHVHMLRGWGAGGCGSGMGAWRSRQYDIEEASGSTTR